LDRSDESGEWTKWRQIIDLTGAIEGGMMKFQYTERQICRNTGFFETVKGLKDGEEEGG